MSWRNWNRRPMVMRDSKVRQCVKVIRWFMLERRVDGSEVEWVSEWVNGVLQLCIMSWRWKCSKIINSHVKWAEGEFIAPRGIAPENEYEVRVPRINLLNYGASAKQFVITINNNAMLFTGSQIHRTFASCRFIIINSALRHINLDETGDGQKVIELGLERMQM